MNDNISAQACLQQIEPDRAFSSAFEDCVAQLSRLKPELFDAAALDVAQVLLKLVEDLRTTLQPSMPAPEARMPVKLRLV